MLVNVSIELSNLGLDLIDERLVLDLSDLLMSEQILVEFLQ